MPSAPLSLKRWVLCGIALIGLVRFVLLLHHFCVDLDGFFLARGDDMIRIKNAALWSRSPCFWPDTSWLPLPSYLLGAAFWIDPDPFTAPAALHLVMSTAVCVMIGILSLELFPARPLAALLAAGGASLLPVDFQRLSLSAGSEVDFWFFALTASISWIRYAKTNKAVFLFLNALSLWLLSMTRYEGWCFLASHSLFSYLLFRRDPSRPRRFFAAYLGLAWSYVAFFVIYQEMTLPPSDMAARCSPLSYVGIRLPQSTIHPSMAHDLLTPLRLFFRFPGSPWRKALAFMELAGAASILLRSGWGWARRGDGSPVPEWHALMVLAQFAAYMLISGVFGMPQNTRVILVMHVLLLPYFGSLLARLAPLRREALAIAAAAALSLLAVFDSIERLRAPFQSERDSSVTFPIARTLHLSERGMSRKPRILVELGTGYEFFDHVPIEFLSLDAPDRVLYDRAFLYDLPAGRLIEEGNPTVLEEPPARLLEFLLENKIGLVIAHSGAAKLRLRRMAVPLFSDGDWSVFGYGLPPALARAYRCAGVIGTGRAPR